MSLDPVPQISNSWLPWHSMANIELDPPRSRVEDPAIGRALRLIHTRFGERLDVAMLAHEAGLSRTVLGERFLKLLGEAPMQYCTRWRLHVAATRLLEGDRRVGDLAYEVGFGSEEAFSRAFRRIYRHAPASWRRQMRRHDDGVSLQDVRFCTTRDGTRLAWSSVGHGFPLVKAANWLNHLSFDWESPVWRPWLRTLARDRQVIRYDERATGLSDWAPSSLSFEDFVHDLETVVDAAGVAQFDLLGISQGAPVAIAYARRHPKRIRRMVLIGGYARGWALRLDGEELARRNAMMTLLRTGWGTENPAFRQMFTNLYIPGGTAEQLGWWNELQRVSTTPRNAERLQHVWSTIDVSSLLSEIATPTLVLHARNDQVVSFGEGQDLAAAIPGAGFVALDSENHVPLEQEPAWSAAMDGLRRFLA